MLRINQSETVLGLFWMCLLGIGSVQAGEAVQEPVSYESYRAAIESFGVEPARASDIAQDIVSEVAADSVSRSLDQNKAPLAGIPDDFLQQNPYAF